MGGTKDNSLIIVFSKCILTHTNILPINTIYGVLSVTCVQT